MTSGTPTAMRPMAVTKPVAPALPELTPAQELALLCRCLYAEGYNDHLAGHITYKQPDATFLVNPFGLTWDEVKASDIVSGYESAKDQYVLIDPEELDKLRSEDDKAIKIDVFIQGERPYDIEMLGRRVEQPLSDEPGDTVSVLAPEDVILTKLDWYRITAEAA